MTDKVPTSLWIVQDANGTIWTKEAYAREDSAKYAFVKECLPYAFKSWDAIDVQHIWYVAKKNGFKTLELKVSA